MSATGGLGGEMGRHLGPRLSHLTPELTTSFVREALYRAIHGVGPLTPAAEAAEKQLREQRGDVERAVHGVSELHIRYAGAQGLLTGLGGVVTAAVTIPTNIAGLALIQARMVAGIAHLRGYDLADPRVHNAILVSMLGEDAVNNLVRCKKLPAPPMAVATAPVHDPHLDRIVSVEVAAELVTKVAGKRLAITAGRKVPIIGGAIGMGADGFATWRVGRYADRELRPRARR